MLEIYMIIQQKNNLERNQFHRDKFKFENQTQNDPTNKMDHSHKDINFSGSPFKMSDAAKRKLYTSRGFGKFAKLTANPVLLDAAVVLGLTCLLRPIVIANMPGAEKRDKQYAAAHSIASGLWGYITAVIMFNPINTAVKNVCNKAKKDPNYLKNSFIKNKPKNTDAFNFVASYGPKLVLQPLVAAGTIALIPAMMNIFFNKDQKAAEKEKLKEQKETVKTQTPDIKKQQKTPDAFKEIESSTNQSHQPQFKGKITPNDKDLSFLEKIIHKLAKPIEPLIEKMAQNKHIKKFSESMANGNSEKSSLMRNILTTGQALTGTLVYITATMKNKKIEEDRKQTLAANQLITWSGSAIGAFILNNAIQKGFNKIAADYKKYNIENLENNLEKITKEKLPSLEKIEKRKITQVTPEIMEKVKKLQLEKLEFRANGIAKTAPTMIAFAFIYRFLTPIIATPLADLAKKHLIKEPEKVKSKNLAKA
ncbi:MAG: hypothetical protein PHE78_01045 [Candidatus Gastranaerophilales bacterium]|nr:hypothetical protein [Candidatus Gastranaerophilales bacterium]